jgi:hypothetical protein
VVQIWPGQTVTCLHTISPGHIWTTLYIRLCLSGIQKGHFSTELITYTFCMILLTFVIEITVRHYSFLFVNTKRMFEAGTREQEFSVNSDKQEVVPSAGIHCHA